MHLLGHAASSPGLRSANLKGKIFDKYWVRISLVIWMGRFAMLSSDDDEPWTDKVLVYLSPGITEFAPGPETRPPTDAQFDLISAVEPDMDGEMFDHLEDAISWSLAKNLFSTKLRCETRE